MRTIASKELPPHFYRNVLIKSGVINRHRCMAAALERTLSHCCEVRIENESRLRVLREESVKEGLSTGVRLFFSQLIIMLDDYEQQQLARMDALYTLVNDALRTSFDDPIIVERIIHHLMNACSEKNVSKVIIPRTVKLPEEMEKLNYQLTDNKDITVQNDEGALRFQSESLCKKWLLYAEKEMTTINEKINNIIPEVLNEIGSELISLSKEKIKNQPASTYNMDGNFI